MCCHVYLQNQLFLKSFSQVEQPGTTTRHNTAPHMALKYSMLLCIFEWGGKYTEKFLLLRMDGNWKLTNLHLLMVLLLWNLFCRQLPIISQLSVCVYTVFTLYLYTRPTAFHNNAYQHWIGGTITITSFPSKTNSPFFF